MRTRLATAPVWAPVLACGAVFGLAMALEHRIVDGVNWSSALSRGGVGGLVFAAFIAPALVRQRRRVLQAAGELSEAQIQSAVRASLRGPVPADPQVRAAAARLSAQQGELIARQRVWALPFFVVLAVAAGCFALTDTPWWWAGVAVFLPLVGIQIVGPERYRRRAHRLQGSVAID